MRIISSILALGAVISLVVGCGSSGSSTTTTTTDAQSGRASTAVGQISKKQAIAYAHEVNLVAADVPGAVVGLEERESGAPSRESAEFARCAGAVNPDRRVVDVKSATFRIGRGTAATQVKSSVEVMPTAALAARNYAAARSPRGHTCLAQALPRVVQGATPLGARAGTATASFLPDLLPPGQESFGVRITTSLTRIVGGKQVRLPVYLDIFELLAGPAEVGLSATSASRPASSTTERRLLSLLYSRAQEHKL